MAGMGGKLPLRKGAWPADNVIMWRTFVSIFFAAILGSAAATTVCVTWLSITQSGASAADDVRTGIAMAFGASWFTIPGAFFLAAVEFGLAERVRSARVLDEAVMLVGAIAGAAILGGLGALSTDVAWPYAALLGGFYGLTTAIFFVFLQRQLGSRRERHF